MGDILPKFDFGAHFLTAVTFRRKPFFQIPACAHIFCRELETARAALGFHVIACGVMLPDVAVVER